MSNANTLAGLVANYGDSEEESDGGEVKQAAPALQDATQHAPIHPAPIPHCPWSACYDESSGFTYYWNQVTNAVTWEAPPEYLLALKLAQQQLTTTGKGTAEVSAEEWQLYQQALIDKQVKIPAKTITTTAANKDIFKDMNQSGKKRLASEDEEKIELITSYHNSDSESNDESDMSLKVKGSQLSSTSPSKTTKNPHKKQKTKSVEYGPPLPPNQDYIEPIGPELPPGLLEEKTKIPEAKDENTVSIDEEDKKFAKVTENDDSQDENTLFQRLKDKAKLLEKLGGELPTELQKIIEEDENSRGVSPKSQDSRIQHNLDIDDLLEEIEKKELPKVKSKNKSDKDGKSQKSNSSSVANSPLYPGDKTPPLEEIKPLFPSSKAITDDSTALFPSAANIEENKVDSPVPMELESKDKKVANVYLNNAEGIENTSRKKLRISNSVLPERKTGQKFDVTAYTTKYAQYMEGFSGERVGLGFTKEENDETSPKNTISYGNGLTFTKGEILNEDKKDEDLDDLADLVEAKLKYLNQLQPCLLTPVQEMLIQLQAEIGLAVVRLESNHEGFYRLQNFTFTRKR